MQRAASEPNTPGLGTFSTDVVVLQVDVGN